MGVYVNPPDRTKEEWLGDHGESTDGPCQRTETHLPVCLVRNSGFSAAAVAINKQELDEFQSPSDARSKTWFRVSREDLRKVSPLAKWEAGGHVKID